MASSTSSCPTAHRWAAALTAAALAVLASCSAGAEETTSSPGGLEPGVVPGPYESLVLDAGGQCVAITPALIAAQIEAESNWEPGAQSSVGAQGISQFMPETWESYGQDENGDGVANVLDPEDAIPAQGRFMCAIADQVDGWIDDGTVAGDVVKLSLAGYNAGPGAVQTYGGIPPYPETQGYVERIIDLMGKYAAAGTGTSGGGGPVVLPVEDGTYSSDNYGDTGSLWSNYHTGNDFAAPCGAPVFAATAGTINLTPGPSWFGDPEVSVLTGPTSVRTDYAHMQVIDVVDGQRVTAGQRLGQAGAEGNVSGCHLHFEVYPHNGVIYDDDVDPVTWLTNNGVEIN